MSIKTRPRNPGNFVYKTITSEPIYNYNYFPLDSREHAQNSYNPYIASFQNQDFPFYYDEGDYDERQGILTMNLKIQKSVSTPPMRSLYSTIPNAPAADIIVRPGVTFTLDKLTNDLNTLTLNKFQGENLGTKILLQSNSTMNFSNGTDYENNATLIMNEYCGLDIQENATLNAGTYSDIWVTNTNTNATSGGAVMIMRENSNINFSDYAEVHVRYGGRLVNCGANIQHSNTQCFNIYSSGTYCIAACAECNISGYTETFTDGSQQPSLVFSPTTRICKR